MKNIERLLEELLKEIRGMREDLALTLAMKRKHMIGKSPMYLKFEEWALERNYFETSQVVAKFCSKPTALAWMRQFVNDHPEYITRAAYGQEPMRVAKKK